MPGHGLVAETALSDDGVELTPVRWMPALTLLERLPALPSAVTSIVTSAMPEPAPDFLAALSLLAERRVEFSVIGSAMSAPPSR